MSVHLIDRGDSRPSQRHPTPTKASTNSATRPGVLAAPDVLTEEVAFWLMDWIRLDLGYGSLRLLAAPAAPGAVVRAPLADHLLTQR